MTFLEELSLSECLKNRAVYLDTVVATQEELYARLLQIDMESMILYTKSRYAEGVLSDIQLSNIRYAIDWTYRNKLFLQWKDLIEWFVNLKQLSKSYELYREVDLPFCVKYQIFDNQNNNCERFNECISLIWSFYSISDRCFELFHEVLRQLKEQHEYAYSSIFSPQDTLGDDSRKCKLMLWLIERNIVGRVSDYVVMRYMFLMGKGEKEIQTNWSAYLSRKIESIDARMEYSSEEMLKGITSQSETRIDNLLNALFQNIDLLDSKCAYCVLTECKNEGEAMQHITVDGQTKLASTPIRLAWKRAYEEKITNKLTNEGININEKGIHIKNIDIKEKVELKYLMLSIIEGDRVFFFDEKVAQCVIIDGEWVLLSDLINATSNVRGKM